MKRVEAVDAIHIRCQPKKALHKGLCTDEGVPTGLGLAPMKYVRSDPVQGHPYRCRREECYLWSRKGVHYCNDDVWQDATEDLRSFGLIRRGGDERTREDKLSRDDVGVSFTRAAAGTRPGRRDEGYEADGEEGVLSNCRLVQLAYRPRSLRRRSARLGRGASGGVAEAGVMAIEATDNFTQALP